MVVFVVRIDGCVETDASAKVGQKRAREQSAGDQAGQAEDFIVKTFPQLINQNGGGAGRWPKVLGLGWVVLTVEVPGVSNNTFVVKEASALESVFKEFLNYCTVA